MDRRERPASTGRELEAEAMVSTPACKDTLAMPTWILALVVLHLCVNYVGVALVRL